MPTISELVRRDREFRKALIIKLTEVIRLLSLNTPEDDRTALWWLAGVTASLREFLGGRE